MSKVFRIVLDGVAHEVEVEEIKSGAAPVAAAPRAAAPAPAPAPKAAAPAPAPAPKAAAPAAGAEVVAAPLQGTILSVDVTAGQSVKAGQNLVVIEAMKMENEVVAPRDCVVKAVHVTKGATVAAGDALVEIG